MMYVNVLSHYDYDALVTSRVLPPILRHFKTVAQAHIVLHIYLLSLFGCLCFILFNLFDIANLNPSLEVN